MNNLDLLLYGQAAASLVMLVGWLIALAIRNTSYVDVLWAYGVGVLGLVYLYFIQEECHPARHALLLGLLGVWSARLGTHLLRRCWGKPEDARYCIPARSLGQKCKRRILSLFSGTGILDRFICQSFSHPRTEFVRPRLV